MCWSYIWRHFHRMGESFEIGGVTYTIADGVNYRGIEYKDMGLLLFDIKRNGDTCGFSGSDDCDHIWFHYCEKGERRLYQCWAKGHSPRELFEALNAGRDGPMN